MLPVSEVFGPTIQGEGPWVGRRVKFLRLAGCDYACVWCDSKFTWQAPVQREMLSEEAIIDRLKARPGPAQTIIISGGNPCLHDLRRLLKLMHDEGWEVAIETQGSVSQPWLHQADYVVVSPKGPSSGMTTDYDKLAETLACAQQNKVCLKVVIFNQDDYAYAQDMNARYPQLPMYLSVGTYTPERERGTGEVLEVAVQPAGVSRWPRRPPGDANDILWHLLILAERVATDSNWTSDPYVLPQLHVLLWGHKKGV